MDKENVDLPERRKRRASAETALQLVSNSPNKRKLGKARGLPFKKGGDDRRRHRSVSTGSTEEVELSEDARVAPENLVENLQRVASCWLESLSATDQLNLQALLFCTSMESGKGIVRSSQFASNATLANWQVVRRNLISLAERVAVFDSEVCSDEESEDECRDESTVFLERIHQKKSATKFWALHDEEELQGQCRQWIKEHSSPKGQPNMKVADFQQWLNTTLLPSAPHLRLESVGPGCAREWLHRLGFKPVAAGKAVYFDGHEREDVVEEREAYLGRLKEMDQCDNVVRVYHDESTFHANADETWSWTMEGGMPIRPKTLGSAIMVSDFITEDGWLQLTAEEQQGNPNCPESSRVLLELGANKDGYFNSEMLIAQTKKALQVFEAKYPGKQALFIFDQAPSHKRRQRTPSMPGA